jgi:hypothetical protein
MVVNVGPKEQGKRNQKRKIIITAKQFTTSWVAQAHQT